MWTHTKTQHGQKVWELALGKIVPQKTRHHHEIILNSGERSVAFNVSNKTYNLISKKFYSQRLFVY